MESQSQNQSQNQSVMTPTLESQILNPREQELLASIRKSGKQPKLARQASTGSQFASAKKQALQEQALAESKRASNSKKVSKQSYRILVDKLERSLNEV